MKKTMRILYIFIIFLALSGLFAACSDDGADNNNQNGQRDSGDDSGANDAAAAEPADYFEARKQVQDSLPEMDFGGEEIKALLFDVYKPFIMSEEAIGEIVNDAVYAANLAVSERFNIKFTHVGEGLGEIQQVELFRRTVKSGDDAFHFASLHDLASAPLSLEGCFVDAYDMKYLDFDKPWWNKDVLEDFTVFNQCYAIFPAMSYMGLARSRVLFMNEDKMADFGLALPYDEVINGTWTLDKLIALTKGAYRDLNGSGAPDNDDFYGFISERAFYGALDSFDIPTMGRGPDGLVSLVADMAKISAMIEKLYDWLIVSGDARFLLEKDGMVGNDLRCDEFAAGKALIQRGQMFEALPELLGSDINYGILPMPKLDERQEKYRTSCGEFLVAVPVTVSGELLDRVSVIIEAMSAEGYKHVFPAYFKIALQVKYFDNQSVQMIDIISENRKPSFSFTYDSGGILSYTVHQMLSSGGAPTRDFASYYERREGQLQGQINRINNAFIKLDAERG